MSDRDVPAGGHPNACPFLALDDDRDRRAGIPDVRHRCFAESPPQPRALTYQESYCLSSAFSGCRSFLDWAARAAAEPVRQGSRPGADDGPPGGPPLPWQVATPDTTGRSSGMGGSALPPPPQSYAPPPPWQPPPAWQAPPQRMADGQPYEWAAPPPWIASPGMRSTATLPATARPPLDIERPGIDLPPPGGPFDPAAGPEPAAAPGAAAVASSAPAAWPGDQGRITGTFGGSRGPLLVPPVAIPIDSSAPPADAVAWADIPDDADVVEEDEEEGDGPAEAAAVLPPQPARDDARPDSRPAALPAPPAVDDDVATDEALQVAAAAVAEDPLAAAPAAPEAVDADVVPEPKPRRTTTSRWLPSFLSRGAPEPDPAGDLDPDDPFEADEAGDLGPGVSAGGRAAAAGIATAGAWDEADPEEGAWDAFALERDGDEDPTTAVPAATDAPPEVITPPRTSRRGKLMDTQAPSDLATQATPATRTKGSGEWDRRRARAARQTGWRRFVPAFVPPVALAAIGLFMAALILFLIPGFIAGGGSPSPTPPVSSSAPAGVGEPGESAEPVDTPVPGDFQLYRVRTGDTVLDIAREFGITQEALICANRALQRDPDRIGVGQQLNIPPKGWECPERAPRQTRRGGGGRASEAPG